MKKLILASLAALAFVPSIATAQPANELRRDRQDIRHDQRDVRDQRRDVRDARQDNRDDVRNYNRAHPWRAAPFRYQRFTVGARIQPAYYGRNYAVTDYRQFRWAKPGANQRWIRHYDDALLVNVRTGRVVKVVYSAFR
jgi:Ni/Co efflux regulator RcnB